MDASVLDRTTPSVAPNLRWQTAAAWIASLNASAEDRARGFEWCRVGIHGRVKHRLAWSDLADGRRVYLPACHQGFNGDSADRVHPVNSAAAGTFCQRLACLYATPDEFTPGYRTRPKAAQLELDLLVS